MAFLLGFTAARPPWKSATANEQSVFGVLMGIFCAVLTAAIVGGWKYFNRTPSSFFGATGFFSANAWKRISVEDAKKHPLYGVRGWLSCFASVLVVGLIQQCQPITLQAFHDGGPTNWWAVNIPIVRALKFALVIYALAAIIIYWLLFSRHRNFRPVSSCILLSIWPAQALRGFLDPSPAVVDALALSFLTYGLHCAVGVTYLQKSKRVRVTFEHSVKAGQDDNVAGTSHRPSDLKSRGGLTDTPTIAATSRTTDQRVVAPKPTITKDPPRDRRFSDDSLGTPVPAIPLGTSEGMSSHQPTADSRTPVAIPTAPNQDAIEEHEDRLYAQIAQELENNTVDKGLWTKAYAQAGGDDQQTRVLYIKARFARLLAMENTQRNAIRRTQEQEQETVQRDATRLEQEQEQDEVARLARAHSIRANLQSRIEEIETAGKSVELKSLAAGHTGDHFLYLCGLGKWFVDYAQRALEENPFVLDRTTLDEGYTGLHIAVRSKDKKMIECLVEQGANIQARDSQGKTPLDMARETNQPEVVALLERFRAEG